MTIVFYLCNNSADFCDDGNTMLLDYFQSMNVYLMCNLVDIIGYAGQVTDGRNHFRADTLIYLTTHRRLMAKFIDRQSGLLHLRLNINVVALKYGFGCVEFG